jgi:hypothetical protein
VQVERGDTAQALPGSCRPAESWPLDAEKLLLLLLVEVVLRDHPCVAEFRELLEFVGVVARA